MNVFDVGGIVTAIAVIVTLLIGTGIFIGINTILEIWYFGFGALIGEWFECVIVAAFIVKFLGGIVGGIFSIIWLLIKIGLSISVISYIGMFIYKKIKGNKAEE
ncbi:MAG: hypothetical protein ACLU7E_20030 [Clostridium butyricum]